MFCLKKGGRVVSVSRARVNWFVEGDQGSEMEDVWYAVNLSLVYDLGRDEYEVHAESLESSPDAPDYFYTKLTPCVQCEVQISGDDHWERV